VWGKVGIFSKIFGKNKNPNSYAFRLERAKSLHGQPIKYVTEHIDGNEDVIGKGGAIAIHEDTLIVDSSGDRLFVCEIKYLDASWLMSGNGVILRGPNLLEGGRERVITVHFVYHRK
jgi:hypothetical protein